VGLPLEEVVTWVDVAKVWALVAVFVALLCWQARELARDWQRKKEDRK